MLIIKQLQKSYKNGLKKMKKKYHRNKKMPNFAPF